jgi:hypothetical protein
MQARFENPGAATLDEETVSYASPQMRIHCVAEKVAQKSTNAVKLFYKDNNQLFEMYWHPGIFSPDSGTKQNLMMPGIKVKI